jgi:predicted metal-dependent hydrolase
MKVQYELKRKKSLKRLSLKVTDNKKVLVSAPLSLKLDVVDQFVNSKTEWIKRRFDEIDKLVQPIQTREYKEKERFLILAKEYTLLIDETINKAKIEDQYLLIPMKGKVTSAKIKKAVSQFYFDFGLELYKPLVEKWATLLKIEEPIEVEMASFPKRMGSCSINNTIKFALRSVMLPLEIVDYLALHEVAHIVHFNHSKEFRKLLESVMADYKTRHNELKRYRLATASL